MILLPVNVVLQVHLEGILCKTLHTVVHLAGRVFLGVVVLELDDSSIHLFPQDVLVVLTDGLYLAERLGVACSVEDIPVVVVSGLEVEYVPTHKGTLLYH